LSDWSTERFAYNASHVGTYCSAVDRSIVAAFCTPDHATIRAAELAPDRTAFWVSDRTTFHSAERPALCPAVIAADCRAKQTTIYEPHCSAQLGTLSTTLECTYRSTVVKPQRSTE
jgi:hypothetical protein